MFSCKVFTAHSFFFSHYCWRLCIVQRSTFFFLVWSKKLVVEFFLILCTVVFFLYLLMTLKHCYECAREWLKRQQIVKRPQLV